MVAPLCLHTSNFLQVPADGILVSGHSLAIDESSMTGESKIVSVKVAILFHYTLGMGLAIVD